MNYRVAFEHTFHDVEAVSGFVAEAKRVLEENGLSPTAMDATLAQVVGLIGGKHVQFEPVAPLGILNGPTLR